MVQQAASVLEFTSTVLEACCVRSNATDFSLINPNILLIRKRKRRLSPLTLIYIKRLSAIPSSGRSARPYRGISKVRYRPEADIMDFESSEIGDPGQYCEATNKADRDAGGRHDESESAAQFAA